MIEEAAGERQEDQERDEGETGEENEEPERANGERVPLGGAAHQGDANGGVGGLCEAGRVTRPASRTAGSAFDQSNFSGARALARFLRSEFDTLPFAQ